MSDDFFDQLTIDTIEYLSQSPDAFELQDDSSTLFAQRHEDAPSGTDDNEQQDKNSCSNLGAHSLQDVQDGIRGSMTVTSLPENPAPDLLMLTGGSSESVVGKIVHVFSDDTDKRSPRDDTPLAPVHVPLRQAQGPQAVSLPIASQNGCASSQRFRSSLRPEQIDHVTFDSTVPFEETRVNEIDICRPSTDSVSTLSESTYPDPKEEMTSSRGYALNSLRQSNKNSKLSDKNSKLSHKNRREDVSPNDYLTGRGGHISRHPGNQRVRKLVVKLLGQYTDKSASRAEKTAIVNRVIQDVRGVGGKFLAPVKGKSEGWVECNASECHRKVSQRFREEASGRVNGRQRKRMEGRERSSLFGPNKPGWIKNV